METRPHISLESLPGRWAPRLAAVALGSLALATGVLAQKPAEASGGQPAHSSMMAECPLSLYNPVADSQPAHCPPMSIPKECVPDTESARNEVRQIHYSSNLEQEGKSAVRSYLAGDSDNRGGSNSGNFKLEVTGQEDAGVVDGAGQIVTANLFTGRAMGANRFRMIVDESRFKSRMLRERFKRAAKLAKNHCGYNVDVTLSCRRDNGAAWQPKRFAAFAGSVTRYFGGLVNRYGICNEPNYPGWLAKMKGMSLYKTTCTLYNAGRGAIKRANKKAETMFGELSSVNYPLVFLRKAAKACKGGIVANLFAYHPYTWFQISSPADPLPSLNDPSVTADSAEAGVTAMPVIKKTVKQLYESGDIRTPAGKVPDITFNEFALMSSGESNLRNIPEESRAALEGGVICRVVQENEARASSGDKDMPKIVGVAHYNLTDQPRSRWMSGVVNSLRLLTPTFFSIRETLQNLNKCVAK